MLKLLDVENLFEPLRQFGQRKPIFGTCAGAILLATEVFNPAQASLGLMDLTVERNAYGRQIDSRIASIELEGKPRKLCSFAHRSFAGQEMASRSWRPISTSRCWPSRAGIWWRPSIRNSAETAEQRSTAISSKRSRTLKYKDEASFFRTARVSKRPLRHTEIAGTDYHVKQVLFLCIGNSCRSQMAEGFANRYGSDVMKALSAGLSPAAIVQPLTRKVMEERNININHQQPKDLGGVDIASVDLIINMSGRPLPTRIGVAIQDWPVEDPIGKEESVYVTVRDVIEMRVMHLILDLRREMHPPKPRERSKRALRQGTGS